MAAILLKFSARDRSSEAGELAPFLQRELQYLASTSGPCVILLRRLRDESPALAEHFRVCASAHSVGIAGSEPSRSL